MASCFGEKKLYADLFSQFTHGGTHSLLVVELTVLTIYSWGNSQTAL